MRLVTYSAAPAFAPRLGVRVGHRVLDVEAASRVDGEPLANAMAALLRDGRGALSRVRALSKAAQTSAGRYSAAMHEERAIRFLPPMADGRLALVDGNHRGETPAFELRSDARLLGHNAKVPADGEAQVLVVPQLAFVVGRAAQDVASEDAADHIAGVTLIVQFAAPAPAAVVLQGPEVVTIDEIADIDDLHLAISVNGAERARASVREQRWRVDEVLAHLSRAQPLQAGDVIAIGIVGEPLRLAPGDTLECALEGLTTLRASVVASA